MTYNDVDECFICVTIDSRYITLVNFNGKED